jgi:hypothetical protein
MTFGIGLLENLLRGRGFQERYELSPLEAHQHLKAVPKVCTQGLD